VRNLRRGRGSAQQKALAKIAFVFAQKTHLIRALDSGQLSYAALDALWPEPLPPDSPLWLHPKVTVMPHVARRPTVPQLVTEIAANIRSVEAGGRLLQEVDKTMGY